MTVKRSILEHIHVTQGDITKETTTAIVNAANPSLLGGGGVDGAIHRAAGTGLLEECKAIGGCKSGEARLTGGYNLPARYIIHTPGPVYRNGKHGEAETLKCSYWNSLTLAQENSITSISFPAISTGVYGYPKEKACRIAIDTVCEFMERQNYLLDVRFVLFDQENKKLYDNYLSYLRAHQRD
jgi:O-acetyl-ADP-ribose deacetylase (regulator of RNase III)